MLPTVTEAWRSQLVRCAVLNMGGTCENAADPMNRANTCEASKGSESGHFNCRGSGLQVLFAEVFHFRGFRRELSRFRSDPKATPQWGNKKRRFVPTARCTTDDRGPAKRERVRKTLRSSGAGLSGNQQVARWEQGYLDISSFNRRDPATSRSSILRAVMQKTFVNLAASRELQAT